MAVGKKRKTEVTSPTNPAAAALSSLLVAAGGSSSLYESRHDVANVAASARGVALDCGWVKAYEVGPMSVYSGAGGAIIIYSAPGKLILSLVA